MIIKMLLLSSLLYGPHIFGASAGSNLQEKIAALEYDNAGLLQSVKEAEEAFTKIMNIVKSQKNAEQKLAEIQILAEQVVSGESAPAPAGQLTPPVRVVGGIPMQSPTIFTAPPTPPTMPVPKPPAIPSSSAVTPPMPKAASSLAQLRQERAARQAAINLVPPPPAPPIFVPSRNRPQPSVSTVMPPATPPPAMPTVTPTPPPAMPAPISQSITTLQPQANFADTAAWLKKFDGTIEKIMQSQGGAEIIRRDVLKEFNDNMPTLKQILIDLPSKTQTEQDELVKNISESIFDILQGADIHDEQLKAGVQNIYEQLAKEPQGQVAARAINNKMNELFEKALIEQQPVEPSGGESKYDAAEREAREAAEAEEKRASALPTSPIIPAAVDARKSQAQFDMYKRQMERDLNNAFQASAMQGGDFNAIFGVDDAYQKFVGALNDPLLTTAQKQELRQLGIQKSYDVLKNISTRNKPNYESIIKAFTDAKLTAAAPKPTPTPGYGTYAPTGGAATNVVAQPAMSTMTEAQKSYFEDIKDYTKEKAYQFYIDNVKKIATKAEAAISGDYIVMATEDLTNTFGIAQLAFTDNRLTAKQKMEVKNSLIIALNHVKRELEGSIGKIKNLAPKTKTKIEDLIKDLLQKAETESSTGMPAQLGSTGSTPSVSLPQQKTASTISLSSAPLNCSRGMGGRGDNYKDLPTLEDRLKGTIASIDRMKKSATENGYFDDQIMLRVIPGAIDLYDNLWRLLPDPSVERNKYIDILLIPLVELQSLQDTVRFKNSMPLDANWKQCLGALIQILQEHRSDFGR